MELVWKALSDTTRRAILDMLKDGPQTTGDLAARFAHDQTRYGVMKHLSVLEDADLITVRREGRKRYNYLNAIPLRAIYERWLGPYQEFWSTNLLRLKDFIEPPNKENNMEYNAFDITQKVQLAASRDKVWAALTKDFSKWWAFRVGSPGSTIHFDPTLGGKIEERWGDGDGVIWGQLIELDAGNKHRLKGPCGMTGAGVSDWSYELTENAGKTTVTLRHHAFGFIDPATKDSYAEGWKGLLEQCLAQWVEQGIECEPVYPEEAGCEGD